LVEDEIGSMPRVGKELVVDLNIGSFNYTNVIQKNQLFLLSLQQKKEK
jgi:hypothetical protein